MPKCKWIIFVVTFPNRQAWARASAENFPGGVATEKRPIIIKNTKK